MIEKVLGRFLLPEKDLSLKLIFDNARNYVIVAGFVAMSRWFGTGKATPVPYVFNGPPKTGWGELMWLSLGIAIVLFLLNLSQSYLIAKRLFKIILEVRDDAPNRPKRSGAAWHVHLLIWIVAMSLTVIVIVMAMLFVVIAIYMVWYAAAGASR